LFKFDTKNGQFALLSPLEEGLGQRALFTLSLLETSYWTSYSC